MNARREATVVIVLGMHRSGTSLVSQIVQRFGVFGGREDEQLAGDDWNSGGYYEVRDVLELNRALLLDHGHNLSLPPLDFDHALTTGGSSERVEAGRALVDDYHARGDGVWVWKDPRFCLTLPWWRALLPRVVPILCLRHPSAVAASMRRRDDYDEPRSIKLWEIYLRHALWVTRELPTLRVEYEALVQDPEAQTARIGAFLAEQGLVDSASSSAGATGSLMRRELVHFQSDDSTGLDPRQQALLAMARSGTTDVEALLATAEECRGHRPDLLELTVQTLRRQLRASREEASFRRRQFEQSLHSASAFEKRRRLLEEQLSEARAQRSATTQTLQETREWLARREGVIEEWAARARALQATVDQQQQRIDQLERRLRKLAGQNLLERIVGKGRNLEGMEEGERKNPS